MVAVVVGDGCVCGGGGEAKSERGREGERERESRHAPPLLLAGHTSGVSALALDPWGRFVVTGGADGTVRVWDLASARSMHVMQTGSKQGAAAAAPAASQRRACLAAWVGARLPGALSSPCSGRVPPLSLARHRAAAHTKP